MLSLGFWEIVVIGGLLLVVVGPERLPKVLRFLGRQYGMVRRAAEDMRRESREWRIRCLSCDRARTVWELGGVRWKARSLGKRTLVRCRVCGGRRGHALARQRGGQMPTAIAPGRISRSDGP